MSSMDDLKNLLQSHSKSLSASFDKKISYEFKGYDIDTILEEASAFFNTARINLDYTILRKARKGVFGAFKFPFKVRVWKTGDFVLDEDNLGSSNLQSATLDFFNKLNNEQIDDSPKVDGEAEITIKKSGVYLNVTAPKYGGRKVLIDFVQRLIAEKAVRNFKSSLIKKIIYDAKGEDVKIAEWISNPTCDSSASIEISANNMKVYVNVKPPILSGRQLEKEEIYDLLNSHDIKYGVIDASIEDIFNKKLYNVPVLIAEGVEPNHGANSKIEYNFITDTSEIILSENSEGRIDYKNINRLQNVVVGQVLARKIPATEGIDGFNVYGDAIESEDGIDTPLTSGQNTLLSKDKLEIRSQIAGKPFLKSGTVSVDPVYEVRGDVDLNIGSIIFLGVVIIRGNVSDGFTVKATKNIEVHGNIGNATVQSDIDVIVKGGIQGKSHAVIQAGRNLTAKFINNANISVENDVIVSEEIVHSKVNAGGKIVCYGKRGSIIGGLIRAGYEISAKFLGSTAYTDTIIEAGIDPKQKEKLLKLTKELQDNNDQLNKLNLNIATINKNKASLSQDQNKMKMLDRFYRAKGELEQQIEEINDDIDTLNEYLASIDNQASISARSIIFPGVDITIRSANFLIKNEYRKTSFIERNNNISPLVYKAKTNKYKND